MNLVPVSNRIAIDAVVISDYSKGLLSEKFLKKIIQTANSVKKPIVVDPKGSNFSKYKNATIITPNQKEASIAVNKIITNLDSLVDAGQNLLAETESEAILITKGKDGMVLLSKNGYLEHFLPSVKQVRNAIGAGDTVVSALALGLAAQLDLIDCVHIANYAAGLAVGESGTSVITLHKLKDRLRDILFNDLK